MDTGGEAGASEDRDADETYSEADIEGETVVSPASAKKRKINSKGLVVLRCWMRRTTIPRAG